MRRVGRITSAVATAVGAMLVVAAPTLGDRAFAPRFAANVTGGNITVAANTLMTCPAADVNCSAAQAATATGSALSNNAYAMARVDIDADPTTFSSSSAQLNLPAGAQVLFAGLYYGGRTSAGSGGAPAPSAASRAQVRLGVPGGGYQTLTGVVDDSAAISAAYQGFVDVTAQVVTAGSGVYTVADVQAGTGVDRYSGWALVVAYRDGSPPPRNLSVFDGLQSIEQGDPPLVIGVSGFETPAGGPVRTRAGFVAYEGDRGGSGDRAMLNGQVLADAVNPANNFFNSAISIDGANVTTKTPNYVNQLGFDAILTGADDYLANGDTAATIELSTTLDQYLPGVVTLATELNPAFVQGLVVEHEDLDDPVKVGEKLHYETTVINDGAEPVAGVEVTTASDLAVSLVDLRSPDAACSPVNRGPRVACELGNLEPGEVDEVTLVVRPLEVGTLTNTATVSAAGEKAASASATTQVKRGRARVELSKRTRRDRVAVGAQARFTIVARTRGKLSAVDLRVCDRLPDGLSVLRAAGAMIRNDRACWRIEELAPGGRSRFQLKARAEPVPREHRVTNVATVEGLNVPKQRSRAALVIAPAAGVAEPTPCKGLAGARRRC